MNYFFSLKYIYQENQEIPQILNAWGGTGKSRVIQLVTKYFERQTIPEKLAKGAYTGIVASLIRGVLFGLTVYRAGMTSM